MMLQTLEIRREGDGAFVLASDKTDGLIHFDNRDAMVQFAQFMLLVANTNATEDNLKEMSYYYRSN